MDIEKLFKILKNEKDILSTNDIITKLNSFGIMKDDPRIESLIDKINKLNKEQNKISIEYKDLEILLEGNLFFFSKVFGNEMVVNDFEKLKKNITDIYHQVINNKEGEVASYIPQLKNVDPEKFGISICSISGQRFSIGNYDEYFCVQSTCKPINYLISLEDISSQEIHKYVGKEPSGSRFNALMLNEEGKPHNPLINAGAIMVCSLIKKYLEKTPGERFENILKSWNRACGNIKKVGFSNATYLSERKTADRNFALAYFMREENENKSVGFPKNTNIIDTLELYFQCCSIEITCEMMSIVAATLANGGICPLTEEKIWDHASVKNCLSLMASCGMYDYSGEFGFTMGFPAKSGVSGVIMIVIPGLLGLCTWSPRLDKYGNSVRGIEFCKIINNYYNFHQYDIDINNKGLKDNNTIKDIVDINCACYLASIGEIDQLKLLYLKGYDLNQGDYDKRTPLHLACCENQLNTVKFLIEVCNCDKDVKDRWGNTPLKDAERENRQDIAEYLNRL